MIAEDGILRVLFVCTGNICRSPIAEKVLVTRLGDLQGRVNVSSAGTRSMLGQGMTDEAVRVTSALGAVATKHQARDLSDAIIRESDLILTATREHRGAVVSAVPGAGRRTFTMKEYARLSNAFSTSAEGYVSDNSPGAFIASVARLRGLLLPHADPEADDIEDPYRRSSEVYDRVGAQIGDSTARIVADLSALLKS